MDMYGPLKETKTLKGRLWASCLRCSSLLCPKADAKQAPSSAGPPCMDAMPRRTRLLRMEGSRNPERHKTGRGQHISQIQIKKIVGWMLCSFRAGASTNNNRQLDTWTEWMPFVDDCHAGSAPVCDATFNEPDPKGANFESCEASGRHGSARPCDPGSQFQRQRAMLGMSNLGSARLQPPFSSEGTCS